MRQLLLMGFLLVVYGTAMSQTNEPPRMKPAETMREMRFLAIDVYASSIFLAE